MTRQTTEPAQLDENLRHTVHASDVLRFALYVLLLPTLLFIAAGSVNWPMGWLYVVVSVVLTLLSRLIMLRLNPALISERAHYTDVQGVKSWDRVLVPIVGLYGPLFTLIVAGLNRRWNWPPVVALWLQIMGLFLLILATTLGMWAMTVNRFFSAVMRIQSDRGHTVVGSGPYSIVRHPGYLSGILGYLVIPLALGSLWALIPGVATTILVIVRTTLEDRTLQSELPGYSEYAQRVRYRLLPGIW